MSYSFSFTAASKSAAVTQVAVEIAKVAAAQPSHEVDKNAVIDAATAFISLLPDSDTQDVYVSVNGSVGWIGNWGAGHSVTQASVSIAAYLRDRP